MERTHSIVRVDTIEPMILWIRGQRVILDADLAKLNGVTTAALNQAVRRNSQRFPPDFAFKLTRLEKLEVITNCDHLEKLKYSKTIPTAFTEHGAIMAASVVNTSVAIEMSVFVVRAFVRLKAALARDGEIHAKLDELEHRVEAHDEEISAIVDAIRRLTRPEVSPSRRIGFRSHRGDDY
jgi:hypothetical protein